MYEEKAKIFISTVSWLLGVMFLIMSRNYIGIKMATCITIGMVATAIPMIVLTFDRDF